MKKLLAVMLLMAGITANAQGTWTKSGGSVAEKAEYRAKALKGLIKGKLSSSARLIEDENGLHRFTDGETVTIIGFTKTGNHHYYAMYSDRAVGKFHVLMPTSSTFTNDRDIDFTKLPSYDDPEVELVLKKQSDRPFLEEKNAS